MLLHMATAFTTWTALYESLLNKVASGQMLVGSFTIAGKTIQFDTKSFNFWLEHAKQQAAQEGGTLTLRTYAKSPPRG
jgi:hypothetical protein